MLVNRIIRLSSLLLIAMRFVVTQCCAQNETNSCLDCHLELEDELQSPAVLFSGDVHAANGLTCSGCHGGDASAEDAETAMSPQKGFIGSPSALKIPDFCGRCHSDPAYMRKFNPSLPTDQLQKYWSSHHGKLNNAGDKKAAQCVSCHGIHNIKPAGDPRSKVYVKNVPETCAHCHANQKYMAPYKIPTNQFEEYNSSIHAKALFEKNDTGAPACNDCHGNHAATPPGISSIGRVCTLCHLAEGELFKDSPHKRTFDDLNLPECAFCHENHAVHALSDEHIGTGEKSLCVECHAEKDDGYQAAIDMQTAIVKLKNRYEQANSLIEDAEKKGVEVSDEIFTLRKIRQSLISLRKLIHTFNPDTVIATADDAMQTAEKVYQAGIHSLQEVKRRRFGLIAFSLITLLLIFLIYQRMKR